MGSFLRTPLGLFTAIVVVGLIVILGAMSAFGGTSSGSVVQPPTPLTPTQFKHAGQGLCLSLRKQLRWLANNKPRNLGVVDRGMHRLNHLTETHQWRRAYLLVHSKWWKSIGRRLGGRRVDPRHMSCGFAIHAIA